LTEKSAQNEIKLNTLLKKFTHQLNLSEKLNRKSTSKKSKNPTPLFACPAVTNSSFQQQQQQQQQRLSKIEQINLINSVVNKADLNFDPSQIVGGTKFKPPKKMSQKAGSNQVNTGDLSLTLSLASTSRQDNQNGLLLFSTNNKPIKNISELENPENILSKLVEFKSNENESVTTTTTPATISNTTNPITNNTTRDG
jgi:hypothetical protein